jgi:hypothetical protein
MCSPERFRPQELLANAYFVRLAAELQKVLLKGDRASILTEDQILDRLGIVDQAGRPLCRFICSHADVSPLAYYRTGESNRGRGEENDVDEHYIATAVEIACEFILRSNKDMQSLFREALADSSQKPQTAPRDERFERAFEYVLQGQGCDIRELIAGDDSVPGSGVSDGSSGNGRSAKDRPVSCFRSGPQRS